MRTSPHNGMFFVTFAASSIVLITLAGTGYFEAAPTSPTAAPTRAPTKTPTEAAVVIYTQTQASCDEIAQFTCSAISSAEECGIAATAMSSGNTAGSNGYMFNSNSYGSVLVAPGCNNLGVLPTTDYVGGDYNTVRYNTDTNSEETCTSQTKCICSCIASQDTQ